MNKLVTSGNTRSNTWRVIWLAIVSLILAKKLLLLIVSAIKTKTWKLNCLLDCCHLQTHFTTVTVNFCYNVRYKYYNTCPCVWFDLWPQKGQHSWHLNAELSLTWVVPTTDQQRTYSVIFCPTSQTINTNVAIDTWALFRMVSKHSFNLPRMAGSSMVQTENGHWRIFQYREL